ncbi:hypothetical protein FHS00_003282 [Limimaricola variabilis]|jgi:hypothetical protein|uniref:SPW repeat-containing integral membrane domain-containing protein n=1 Tax=Limimaricola variabilis TaxID=1492771 RepID=A0ABR6HSZ7_9RHOB|nr:SPW repeat protein [Limimaricola variabilis]MBB3713677.1 hypothetical protein [Limimaricola variabilis]WPY93212.1 SPW repeat protein [Limimaricola variabilis]
MTHRHHWQDWLFGAIGLWLVASPFMLGMAGGSALWSVVALGALVATLALVGLLDSEQQSWIDMAVAVIAILVVAAPWMLGFTAMAIMAWNAVLCGIVLAVAALWEHLVPHQGGHA